MKKIMMGAAVLSLLATGCQNEVIVEQSQPQEGQLFTLEVGKNLDSRTILNGTATHWSEDDKILVSGANGEVQGVLSFEQFPDKTDRTKARFSGYISGGQPEKLQHIVFPVPQNGKIDMSKRNPGKLDAPMVGTIGDGAVQTLKNVGCIVAFNSNKPYDVEAISNGQNMSGGHYEFDAAKGELTYVPGDSGEKTPGYQNGDLIYVPVATSVGKTQIDEYVENTTKATLNNVEIKVSEGDVLMGSSTIDKITEGTIYGDDANENAAPEVYAWDGKTIDTDWYKADVTNFEIGEPEKLAGLAKLVNEGNTFTGKTIKLTKNIDLNGQEWTPIGKSKKPFSGTFDGQNCIISNVVITGSKSDVGLFGYTINGEIKNLTVNNAQVSGYLDVAVVAGTPYTCKYTNINVIGHVEVNGYSYVGTVGGKNAYADWLNVTIDVDETSYVKAISFTDEVTNRTYVGGACGFNGEGSHSFTNITSNIDVEGSTCDVGGLFGIAHYGNSFINCSSSGNVTITDAPSAYYAEEIGGIAGVWHNQTGTKVTFNNCSFTGTLETNIIEGVDLSDNMVTGKAYSSTGEGKLIIE